MHYEGNEKNYGEHLEHFGVKGMKWGVRKSISNVASKVSAKRQANKDTRKEFRKDKGPKRYHLYDAANSATRTYYRKERTSDFKTYRNQSRKLDLKVARLSDEQVKNGRYRVARARNIKRKTLSTLVGTAAGIALVGSGAAAIGIPAGIAVGVATNFASGGHYYARQTSAYGNARARYKNQ